MSREELVDRSKAVEEIRRLLQDLRTEDPPDSLLVVMVGPHEVNSTESRVRTYSVVKSEDLFSLFIALEVWSKKYFDCVELSETPTPEKAN